MKISALSFGIVGLWDNIKSSIPILKNEFCKDLFGDVYNTNTGLTLEGYVISLPSGRLPFESIIIRHDKIQFITHDLNKLLNVTERVVLELSKIKEFSTSLKAIGFNTEFEVSDIGIRSNKWLTDNFINTKKISQNFQKNEIITTDIKFDIVLSDVEKLGLIIQPRIGLSDAIYLKTNFHVENEFKKFPDKKMIMKSFDTSYGIFENQIASLF